MANQITAHNAGYVIWFRVPELWSRRRSRTAMISSKKLPLVVGSVVGVATVALAVFVVMSFTGTTSTVMTKRSPDKQHTATLSRVQGIDVNFRIIIDGCRVYGSPDFAPIRADFREQLFWDTNSQAVVLEVAGRRIFGYHVSEKRPLKDSELSMVHLTPFEMLKFEGALPKETVTR